MESLVGASYHFCKTSFIESIRIWSTLMKFPDSGYCVGEVWEDGSWGGAFDKIPAFGLGDWLPGACCIEVLFIYLYLIFPQQPSTAYCSSPRSVTLWKFPPSMLPYWLVWSLEVWCRQPCCWEFMDAAYLSCLEETIREKLFGSSAIAICSPCLLWCSLSLRSWSCVIIISFPYVCERVQKRSSEILYSLRQASTG